jgi:hypothetical protein
VIMPVRMRLRLVGVRAVVVMGMAEPVAVAVAIAAQVFVGESLPRHRSRNLERSLRAATAPVSS